MIIGALPRIQQPDLQRPSEIPTKSAVGAGNTLPPEYSGENVDISEAARLASEHETRNIAEARKNQELIDLRGLDGKIRLGLMALGQSTVDDWSSRGLELEEESIIAAAEAFQSAFRENLEKNGSSTADSSIALNRHQIVINSQAVPDWFVDEYEDTLSSMDNSQLKSAFENGDAFYVSQLSTPSAKILSRYAVASHSI